MPAAAQWAAARARQQLYAALRTWFGVQGYLEVETPYLVATPGMEPHIDPFETAFVPQTGVGRHRSLYLHTSPEYAMKRLLADGSPPLFQLCKTFRNGEISPTHNPEFTMLEFYRPHADYSAIMRDLEQALASAPNPGPFSRTPYERLTVREALVRHAELDLAQYPDGPSLKRAAEARGIYTGQSTDFDDLFFHVFLERVERNLGHERPTFLIEYPASMASLSRLKPSDESVAERVELYANGLELANGFTELTDAVEQRRRLTAQSLKAAGGDPEAMQLDEDFLRALEHGAPPMGGQGMGIDRLVMLLTGQPIRETILFPLVRPIVSAAEPR